MTGIIVSNKMNKTVVVEVSTRTRHPKYGKFYKQKKRFPATYKFLTNKDSKDFPKGMLVEIKEIRPISKTIRWSLVDSI
jgi:small subunit ribosomal protein S17